MTPTRAPCPYRRRSPRSGGWRLSSRAAAALIVVHEILALVVGRPQPSEIAEFLREPVVAIVITLDLAGFTLLLLALTGLFERQAHALGKLGLAGYLIAFVGTVLAAGDWWFELFGTPYFAKLAPRAAEQPASGRLLLGGQVTFYSFAAGWTMFGIASVRARVYPRAAAILLIVGGLAGLFAGLAPLQLPLALAVGWIGWWLYRSSPRRDEAREPGGLTPPPSSWQTPTERLAP